MNPTAPKTYKAGQTVKLQVIVSTNHGGEGVLYKTMMFCCKKQWHQQQ